MTKRKNAIHRLGSIVWTYAVTALVLLILLPLAVLWFVIDFVIQVITGKEGLTPMGAIPTWTIAVWNWAASNNAYAFFGQGSFTWLPQA